MKTRLKELRARDGLNQTELAKLAKISRQTGSLIEREEFIPSLLIAVRIAKIFDESIVKKAIGQMLAGAAVGFILMYILLDFQLDVNIPFMSTELMIIFMVITILLILFSLSGYVRMKRMNKKELSGEEEDNREEQQYRTYCDISFAINTALYFSILTLAIVAVTEQHNAFIFITLALSLLCMILNFVYLEMVNKISPERNLPSVNDKQYAKKLLEMSDEGERHVMLQGLYGAFTSMNALLLFALFLMIAYSVITGVSQLFGIFIIVFILVVSNLQYVLKIRNK